MKTRVELFVESQITPDNNEPNEVTLARKLGVALAWLDMLYNDWVEVEDFQKRVDKEIAKQAIGRENAKHACRGA
ncbi:hypothetical protein D6779_11380 [Candidatus Parcubacteria bacterium]|nr:MAG: hypothetical protein D6779_11380 [Candidatus Parcubacteria bacterium]